MLFIAFPLNNRFNLDRIHNEPNQVLSMMRNARVIENREDAR